MNPFLLWMRRRALVALLLILLLSVGTAFGSVGVSAYLAANRQTEVAVQAYTTVAIPYDPVWLGRTPVESFTYKQRPPCQYYDLDAILKDAPVEIQSCPAVPLQGIIPDSIPIKGADYSSATSSRGWGESPYFCCVVAVRCDRVTDISETNEIEMYNESGKLDRIWKMTEKNYSYRFTTVEPLCFPETSAGERPIKKTLQTTDNICLPDGSPIFEEGKTYLLWGQFVISAGFVADMFDEGDPTDIYRLCDSEMNGGGFSTSTEVLWYVQKGDIPYYAEYTGSVEDFLNSEEGKSWKDLIEAADRNHHSVKILATDSVESLAPFCTRYNDLLDGRYYTAEEARTGAKVCVVPALWAEKNGVHVGDMLPISLYAPEYDVIQFVGHNEGVVEYTGPETDQAELSICPSYPEDYTGQTDDYEVVGIYTCPPPEHNSLRFDPDTVLIPKGAVENADQYITEDMKHYPLLNAYLLPNGAQEQLESWLTEQGLGGNFLYFDYGYSVAEDAIEQMSDNGSRVLIGGIAAFALSLLLFALLLRLLTSHTARFMRLLGQSKKTIRRGFFRTIPIWTVSTVLLGGLVGWLSFDLICSKLLSKAVAFDFGLAGLAALAEAVVICAVLTAVGIRLSKTRIMRGGRT